jgi:hypothetical protein
MIANRLLSREEWEAKLRRRGCEPFQGKGTLNTAELWKRRDGYPFTVPTEADGSSEFWAIKRLCDDLDKPPPAPPKPEPPARFRPRLVK